MLCQINVKCSRFSNLDVGLLIRQYVAANVVIRASVLIIACLCFRLCPKACMRAICMPALNHRNIIEQLDKVNVDA